MYSYTTAVLDQLVGSYVLVPEMDVGIHELTNLIGLPKPVRTEISEASVLNTITFERRKSDNAFLMYGLDVSPAPSLEHKPIIFRPHEYLLHDDFFGKKVKATYSVRDGALVQSLFVPATCEAMEVSFRRRGDLLCLEVRTPKAPNTVFARYLKRKKS